MLDHLYNIQYEEEPDYTFIVFLLKKALMDLDIAPGGIYSSNDNSFNSESDSEEDDLEIPEDPVVILVNNS